MSGSTRACSPYRWACLLLLLGLLCAFGGQAAAKPNIIFFLTDDQGWQDLACYGHPYLKTPNFDRLAREGTRFEQFYVNASVCSPSRAAFMTGTFPARQGIHAHFSDRGHNRKHHMPNWVDPKGPLVTRILQEAGYRTGHFGKWHMGHVKGAPSPAEYGIDEHRILAGKGRGWDRDGNPTPSDVVHASYVNNSSKDRFWTHSTDLIIDQAVDFLSRHQGQPFYLNLWTILPHAPNVPTSEQLAAYENLAAKPTDFQGWMRDYATASTDFPKQLQTYCAAVAEVDRALGRLLKKLDERQLTDNTLIFFTSDNGPEDYHIRNASHSGMGATGPLRGRKRSLYEGGVRMPCIARWPGKIPAGRVDKTSVMAAVDWLPTVCSVAGVPLPDVKADGESILDLLTGSKRSRQKPLFWEFRSRIHGDRANVSPTLAIRNGQWKLFANADGSRPELYDIPNDPSEKNNLAKQNPDVVARLLPQLLDWKKELP